MDKYTEALRKEYFENIPSDIVPYIDIRWSQDRRLWCNFAAIKATNLMLRKGMIMSCFKVTYGGGSSIYGYLYSEVIKPKLDTTKEIYGSNDDGWFAKYIGAAVDKFEHRHLCYGPTYHSMDGEFRGRFIQWNQLFKFIATYPELYDAIEKVIVDRMESRTMQFQVDICYPENFNSRDDFEASIDETRISIRIFALCWLVDMYEIYFEIDANHMNPGYYTKIFTQEESQIFENILVNICDRDKYRDTIHDAIKITDIMKGKRELLNPQTGQKIFTMSIVEASSPWNINFPFWRELYATKKCAELVLSMLTPGHPLLIDWFYITNTHAGIFETLSSHEKFEHSRQAAIIDKRLKDIEEATHIDAVRANAYVSPKFKGLSQEIWGAVHYGESFIELTNITVGMLIEHVGFTLADLPSHIIESGYITYTELFTNYKAHARLQFEYLLSLYLMHSHHGIIHSDLHYNNCTVFEMWRLGAHGKLLSADYESGYVLRGKLYSFAFNGLYGCIIDMSRSIIGVNRGVLVDEFGEFATDTFMRNQYDYVMEVITNYFNEYVTQNRSSLRAALEKYPETFLKIVTAVDALSVGENILRLAREPILESKIIKIDPRCLTLARAIVKRARELFINNMNDLLENHTSFAYPTLVIIEELFSEFVVTDRDSYYKNVKLNDVINADGAADKTLERGLKSWNYCNPEEAKRLRALDGKGMPQEYLDFIDREKNSPFVVKPNDKLGAHEGNVNEIPAWMYN